MNRNSQMSSSTDTMTSRTDRAAQGEDSMGNSVPANMPEKPKPDLNLVCALLYNENSGC